MELYELYEVRWYWPAVSANGAVPWSLDFIDLHKERWDWASLSNNRYLPWSLEFIELYRDKWQWFYLDHVLGRRMYGNVTEWFNEAAKNKNRELSPYIDNLIARNLKSKDDRPSLNISKNSYRILGNFGRSGRGYTNLNLYKAARWRK